MGPYLGSHGGRWWDRTTGLRLVIAAIIALNTTSPEVTTVIGPTAGEHGGSAMRLRLGRARLLGGLVGARNRAKGGDLRDPPLRPWACRRMDVGRVKPILSG